MVNSNKKQSSVCGLSCTTCEDRDACMDISINRREVLKFLTMAGLSGALAGCAPAVTQTLTLSTAMPTSGPGPFAPDYWPTDGWRGSTPEEQGLDSTKLAGLYEFIKGHAYNDLHSLSLIRNGYVIAEAARYPYQLDQPHRLGDSFKAFLSALVGIAISEGHLKSIDQPVVDIFAGHTIDNLDGNKKALTIEHLVKNLSGIQWTHPADNLEARHSGDWVQYVLDRPMDHEPGTRFSGARTLAEPYLLAAILEHATGMDLESFAKSRLFAPLGITNVYYDHDPLCVALSVNDIAKFGYLYLNKGQWDGVQIIPEEWVAASLDTQYELPCGSYAVGYHWWVPAAQGLLRRHVAWGCNATISSIELTLVPEANILYVVATHPGGRRVYRPIMETFVLESDIAAGPKLANPDGIKAMDAQSAVVSQAPTPKDVPDLPDLAHVVDKQVYVFDDNSYGLDTMIVNIEQKETAITLTVNDEPADYPIGLDKVPRISQAGPLARLFYGVSPDDSVALMGAWRDDRLQIDVQFLCGCLDIMNLTWNANAATITINWSPSRKDALEGVRQI
jgi:CubicO group peptidase (beta-lactamase class C family)